YAPSITTACGSPLSERSVTSGVLMYSPVYSPAPASGRTYVPSCSRIVSPDAALETACRRVIELPSTITVPSGPGETTIVAPGRGGSSKSSHAAEGGGGSGGSPVDPESSGPGPVVSPSSPLVVVADVPGAVVVAVPLPSATLVSPSSASSEPVPQAEAVKTAASPSAATRHGWTRACKRRSSMRGRYYRRPDGA